MPKVCRLCLQKLQRGSKYFNINAVESFTGFMPYRDQLTTCIPEMALDLIPNPVICNNCRTALKNSYDFKTRCLQVEKKIRQHIESQSDSAEVNYDLSQITVNDLPPFNKIPLLKKELEQDESLNTAEASQAVMDLQKEVFLTSTGEIEITSVPKRNGKYSYKGKPLMTGENPTCFKCSAKFPDVGKLLLHKAVHGDEFNCNFCNTTFTSLQKLRKHNNECSKALYTPEKNSILTKRPHLPTKAKNHLKRWLFRHTDHPYPTDHEKQILMQETNLSLLQVENWFINARRRILQDLTKLKSHGLKYEDVSDTTLGLQLELEDIVSTPSMPQPEKRPENILLSLVPQSEKRQDHTVFSLSTPQAETKIEIEEQRVEGNEEEEDEVEEDEDESEEMETETFITPDLVDPLDISCIKKEILEERASGCNFQLTYQDYCLKRDEGLLKGTV